MEDKWLTSHIIWLMQTALLISVLADQASSIYAPGQEGPPITFNISLTIKCMKYANLSLPDSLIYKETGEKTGLSAEKVVSRFYNESAKGVALRMNDFRLSEAREENTTTCPYDRKLWCRSYKYMSISRVTAINATCNTDWPFYVWEEDEYFVEKYFPYDATIVVFQVNDTTSGTGEILNEDLEPLILDIVRNGTLPGSFKLTDPFDGKIKTQRQLPPPTPPPTTPPWTPAPVGKDDIKWHIMGLPAGVIAVCFLCCFIVIWCVQTKKVRKKIFTPINSNKAKSAIEIEMEKKQYEDKMWQKEKDQKLNKITENAIDEDTEPDMTSSRVSVTKRKNRNAIHPVTDAQGIYLSDIPAYYFRESAMIDSPGPRLVLDISSDEDDMNESNMDTIATIKSAKNKHGARPGVLPQHWSAGTNRNSSEA